MTGLVGHEQPWSEWRAALQGSRLHHGWILAGKRGIGKASFAMQAARELVAEDGVPQPAGDHPDIMVLTHLPVKGDEKKKEEGKPYQLRRNITIEQVREMQQRITKRPTLGSRRVIIIDPADDLEKGASNALLKSLEEPPVGTFFLLVTHRPGRLLPTIRSRCRALRFPELSDAQIDAVLASEAPEADAATRAAAIAGAGGSPGVALEFVELELGKLHKLMVEIVRNGDAGFKLRGMLADAMGTRPDRQRQMAAIELARSVVTREMDEVDTAGIPDLVEAHANLVRLAAQFPTYNFDPGLLVMEIGTLLTNLAASRETANG